MVSGCVVYTYCPFVYRICFNCHKLCLAKNEEGCADRGSIVCPPSLVLILIMMMMKIITK